MRKLDANSVTLEMQRQSRTHREKKWIMWLLQVWRVNERKPTWLTVSRQWPKEYETILMEVGPWNIVEYKLEMAHKIQEQTAETKMLTELQKSRALGARCKYSLEDHILGLIKLMEHLQLDRLPTLQELANHATVLGIPHRTSYERQLVTKENWAGCIQKYQEAESYQRPEILRTMEIDLAKQRQARWERDGVREKAVQFYGYDREQCLQDLAKVYQHFERIPTRKQIDQYAKENHLICYCTMLRHLGPMQSWSAQLADYLAQKGIEEYIETCANFQTNEPWRADSLLQRALKTATASETLIWENVAQKLEKVTKKQSAVFQLSLEGRNYEVEIRLK